MGKLGEGSPGGGDRRSPPPRSFASLRMTIGAACLKQVSDEFWDWVDIAYRHPERSEGSGRGKAAINREDERESMPAFHVYILASRSRVLYVGVTNHLAYRVQQHKDGINSGFTHRYKINPSVIA
jgi:hypothetical protein